MKSALKNKSIANRLIKEGMVPHEDMKEFEKNEKRKKTLLVIIAATAFIMIATALVIFAFAGGFDKKEIRDFRRFVKNNRYNHDFGWLNEEELSQYEEQLRILNEAELDQMNYDEIHYAKAVVSLEQFLQYKAFLDCIRDLEQIDFFEKMSFDFLNDEPFYQQVIRIEYKETIGLIDRYEVTRYSWPNERYRLLQKAEEIYESYYGNTSPEMKKLGAYLEDMQGSFERLQEGVGYFDKWLHDDGSNHNEYRRMGSSIINAAVEELIAQESALSEIQTEYDEIISRRREISDIVVSLEKRIW